MSPSLLKDDRAGSILCSRLSRQLSLYWELVFSPPTPARNPIRLILPREKLWIDWSRGGRSTSQEVLGNLEQEPKPADGRGNERNRKYSVLQTAKHQKRYRSTAKPQRNLRLNLTGQGY
jgi:hypothetical protein